MKKTEQDIIAEAIEVHLSEAEKSSIGYSNEPGENEVHLTEAKLKMNPEHYAELKKRISGLADKIPGHIESVRKDPRVKDLGKRVRFDVLHATKLHNDHDLYANDVNDDHIDSALKSAFKELNIKDS